MIPPRSYVASTITKSKYRLSGSFSSYPAASRANIKLLSAEVVMVVGVGSKIILLEEFQQMISILTVCIAVVMNNPMKTMTTMREQMPPDTVLYSPSSLYLRNWEVEKRSHFLKNYLMIRTISAIIRSIRTNKKVILDLYQI